MDRTDFGQRPGGDLTLLAEKDGSSSYDSHSVGVSSVSTDARQSGTLTNITYPSELMLQEPTSVPTPTMNSAYNTHGTGSQGLDQLNFQASYEPTVVQPHYTAQKLSAGAHTTYGPTASPILLDGSTLTPVPAGVPLAPRSSTPGYLVDTSVTSTVPSRDVHVGSLLPGLQDLTWSTTSTAQAGGATAQQPSSLPNTSGMGHDLGVASERDIEERLARMQNVMEEKFGMQRKKFMNHMIQVDGKTSLCCTVSVRLSTHCTCSGGDL